MSVTFSICTPTTERHGDRSVTCYREVYPDNFDTTPRLEEGLEGFGPIAPENPWTMNVSNSNAADILRTLGFWNDELVGAINPDELIAAIDNALDLVRTIPEFDGRKEAIEFKGTAALEALADVFHVKISPEERTDIKEQIALEKMVGVETGPTFIDCGRPVGYFNQRFTTLRQLAVLAKERNCFIAYA